MEDKIAARKRENVDLRQSQFPHVSGYDKVDSLNSTDSHRTGSCANERGSRQKEDKLSVEERGRTDSGALYKHRNSFSNVCVQSTRVDSIMKCSVLRSYNNDHTGNLILRMFQSISNTSSASLEYRSQSPLVEGVFGTQKEAIWAFADRFRKVMDVPVQVGCNLTIRMTSFPKLNVLPF